MDIRTLMAARLYVRDTANALGAVKGSPCTITSITEADDGIHIVFSWTGTDGTVATQTAIMPYVAVDKVALPLAVTGVPNTGSPHQVFVTDSEGKPGWDDRKHWVELAAICPEIFSDPDVEITYDAGKTEIADNEYKDNTDIEVAYFPNVKTVGKYGIGTNSTGNTTLKAAIFPSLKSIGIYAFRRNNGLECVYAPNCDYINGAAFEQCERLRKVDFPGVISLENTYGVPFHGCKGLTEANFENCTQINTSRAFGYCTSLKNVNFPKLATIGSQGREAFYACSALEHVDFPMLQNISAKMFTRCTALATVILRSETLCALDHENAFSDTPIASGTGYIYVPSALIEEYKAAANWSTYAAQFRSIEDYPEICDPDWDGHRGDVVIPSGKSLTLEAGATVNDPDGVLGGGGGVQTVNGVAPDENGNVEINSGIPTGNATGDNAVALMPNATSSGVYSFAAGYEASATANQAFAIGLYTKASGVQSIAMGSHAEASQYSMALGHEAITKARNAYAFGNEITAYEGQTVLGNYGAEDPDLKYTFIIANGNGSSSTEKANAMTIDASHNACFYGNVEGKSFILPSSTEGSAKRFKITVDDSGTLTATEVTE